MKKLSLLFAVIFAATTMFAETATWVPSEQEYENAQVIETATFGANDAITLTFAKGTNNNNAPAYYNTGTAVRLYGGNTVTVSAGSELMSEIVFTFSATDPGRNVITASADNYESGTWTGSASEITFTVGGTSNHRRIASISVTYAAGGASDDSTVVPVDTTPVIVPVTMENLTFNAGVWNQDNAKFGAWVWGENLDAQFTDFFVPGNDNNLYLAQVPETADSIVFVRFADTVTVPAWGNGIVWNQTINYAVNHADMYFTITDWTTGTWGTPVVYNTCADVNAVTTNTNMTLNEVTVVFAKGAYIYVKDATGTTLVYTNAYSTLQAGDRVSGIAGEAKLYRNLPELAPTTAIEDLTIVPGEAPVIFDAQAAPTADNVNEVMMFRGVHMPTASFTTSSATNITGTFAGEQVAFRNNWKEAYDFDSTKTYTMLGCVAIYNTTLQVYVTNIEEEVAPVQHYYIKNNWNGGSDWTWVEMNPVMNNVLYDYTGVFGGSGVNINTAAEDNANAIWFPVADFRTIDSTYVPQALDTIHFVYSIVDSVIAVELVGRPAPAPVQYFIKNNWNGGSDWAWVEMNTVIDNVLYDYTGVFGGTGVDINTMASDAGSTWFSVADFRTIDSTYVPQALDTIHFVYSILDSALAVELVGRPAVDTVQHYYIKNNWNGGSDWTWEEMSPVENNVLYEYTGVFGGSGVDINTMASDNGSTWFPVADFRTIDSTYVPQALDTIHFVYSIVDSALAVELVGRPAPAPVQYYIKNNWNGGSEWTWEEMSPVENNVLYEYTGVFGGLGVDINTMASDAGSTWFPVADFRTIDSTYVPQALDTIHFVYSIVDSALAVELVGRPEPIIIDSVTTILNITNVTGWENLYVYAWGGAEIFGSWPGEIALEQIIISGNYEGQTEHLIFNNGAGTQLADFDIVLMDTVYNIVVRADGAYFPEDVPTTNTCAEVNAITEATNMTLGEVTVVFAKGSNIYVQDATATTLVYTNKYADLVPGDRVQGIAGQAKLYYGLPELAATTEFADLVVTAGQAPRIPDAKTAPTMADINKVMMFRNVTMLDSAFTTPNNKAMNINGIFNGDTVTFRNNWKDTYTFEQGKTYTMLGCVAVYNNAIQVYVTNIEEYVEVPVQYYIKNNWNGGSAWTWEEMSPVLDNVLYEYTGVFGGTGVNINTTTSDDGSTWFPVENFSLIDSTYVPQAMDTIHFVYSIVDATLAVELVGRPAGDSVLHYYIKNNWEAGSEWTWVEMDMVVDNAVYEYTGVFGGTGVNINTMATDAGAIWFPVEDFSLIDSTYVPQALDTIHFVYSIVDSALAVELVGRPVIEEIQYYIKNNWNGGEWTWEEMTPANDGNITWTYRGIFGGTGVNINNLPIDADAIWFPVDKWLFTTLGYVPEAGDDILFEFDSELLTLTATFMGKDGLETITFQREGETMKLIHNGQLYIIRDGKMYNALGAQVR